jgi:hypothetical protein
LELLIVELGALYVVRAWFSRTVLLMRVLRDDFDVWRLIGKTIFEVESACSLTLSQ